MDTIEYESNLAIKAFTVNHPQVSSEAKFFRQQKAIPMAFNIVDEILKRSQNTLLNKPALCFEDKTISWGELNDRFYGYQKVYEQLGIHEGSRVALVSLDSDEMALAIMTLMFCGCTVILINPMIGHDGIATQLESAQVDVALMDDRSAILPRSNTIRHISLSTLSGIYTGLDKRLINFDYKSNTSPFSPAFGVFTSGSTGKPKLVIHCHQDIMVALTRYADQVLDIRRNDVIFCASRLSFAFGLQNMFLALLNSATYLLPPEDIHATEVLKIIEQHKATMIFAVPRVYDMLLKESETAAKQLSSLRLCISAGEALPLLTYQTWQQNFGQEIISSLGSTEVFSTYISNIPGSKKLGAAGKLIPGFQAKLINDDGNPSQVDEPGVLWIRGPSVITQYDDKQLEKSLFSDGWFCTNDVFKQDIDGYYYFLARNNEMIKINGLWVSPNEIEETLKTLEIIKDAAVVPFSRDNGAPSVKAFIVLKEGVTTPNTSDIKDYCKSRMSSWKYPHFIEFIDELPRTVTGKLARHMLKNKLFSNTTP
jgi:acyl-coenzyme A synthetase/AMP-(fatty) acid ligase